MSNLRIEVSRLLRNVAYWLAIIYVSQAWKLVRDDCSTATIMAFAKLTEEVNRDAETVRPKVLRVG